jgi:hypothetical protein
MVASREVWFSEEAWISIYLENTDGTWVSTPTHEFRYVQNVSVKKNFDLVVFGQPGAGDNDINSMPGIFECSIGEYFWAASEQWIPFLNPTRRWRVAIQNINPSYDGVEQKNDAIILRGAAISSPGLSSRANDIQVSTLDFRAESIEDESGYPVDSNDVLQISGIDLDVLSFKYQGYNKSFRAAHDTVMEVGGSYAPTGTWDWSGATVTWPAHAIDGAQHTASGLTAGHVMQALSATTFGFAAIPTHKTSHGVGATDTVFPAAPGTKQALYYDPALSTLVWDVGGGGTPAGGTTGQALVKASNVDYATTWATINKSYVGLGNVENTALSTWAGSANIAAVGTITTGVWHGTAIQDSWIASAATWSGKQNAYANLTAIGNLANGTGWLRNNGSGVFNYSVPSKSDVGLGSVENTALSTWSGSTNLYQVKLDGATLTSSASGLKVTDNTFQVLNTRLTAFAALANPGSTLFLTSDADGTLHWAAGGGTGIPSGGTTNQALTKSSNADYATAWTTIDKAFVGLSNVENTALSTWTGSSNLYTVKLDGSTLTSSASGLKVTDSTFQPLNTRLTAFAALSNPGSTLYLSSASDGTLEWSSSTATATWEGLSVSGSQLLNMQSYSSIWSYTSGFTVQFTDGNISIGAAGATASGCLDINHSGGEICFTGMTTLGGVWSDGTATIYIADWATGNTGLKVNVSTGNVGIGCTPATCLHVCNLTPSSSTLVDVFQLTEGGTGGVTYPESALFKISHGGPSFYGTSLHLLVNGAANTDNIPDQQAMTWDYLGNVGIGITDPTTYMSGCHGLAIYGTYPAVMLNTSSSRWGLWMSGSSCYLFNSTASNVMTFTTGGLVGIGNGITPTTLLTLATTNSISASTDSGYLALCGGKLPTQNNGAVVVTYGIGYSGSEGLLALYAGDHANGAINFFTDALSMTILHNGNVGIGTSAPFAPLHVQPVSGSTAAVVTISNADFDNPNRVGSCFSVRFGATSGNTYSELLALDEGANSWNNLVMQTGGGYVGIGTTTPATCLHVCNLTPSSSTLVDVFQLTEGGTGGVTYPESALFKISHGGPSFYGTSLHLLVNGAANTNNIPDQQAMTWDYLGNVGIGISNPTTYIAGCHGLAIYGTNPAVMLNNSSSQWGLWMSGSTCYLHNSTASNVMTFTTDGFVGIGCAPLTTLSVNGGVSAAIRYTSTDSTATASDFTVIIGAGVTLTLPTAANTGQILVIKNTSQVSSAYFARAGSDNIRIGGSNVTSVTLAAGTGYMLQADGAGNWYAIAQRA